MIKRSGLVYLGLCITILMAGCGGGEYGDVVEVNNRFITLMEKYVSSLESVSSAGGAAKIMNDFAEGIEKLAPEMKALAGKYPELKNPEKLPETLKVSQKKAEEAGKKFAGSMMKLMPYMMAPEVQAAQQRIARAMQSMQ